MWTRRTFLGAVAALAVGGAGCSGRDGPPTGTDVVVGPDTRLTFDPGTVTLTVGETLTWYFASNGHNVSCKPEHHDAVELPAEAESFASYDGDGGTEPQGATYDHTFDTPGTYHYVCLPHAPKMAGTVRVEE